MVICLIVWTLSFVPSLNANFVSTTQTSSRDILSNTSMTSFSHKNISATRNHIDDKRIVGGTIIKPYFWPFLARVHTFHKVGTFTQKTSCGGAVYNESYIITAAHCVHNLASKARSNLKVTAGEHSISLTEGHEQERNVSKIIVHPRYDAKDLQHDIALLKLSSPLNLSTIYVTRIELNDDNSCPPPGDICSVAGYGKLKEAGRSLPDVPYEVRIPVMSNHECSLIKHDDVYQRYNFDYNICARDVRSRKDICRGDSGGPFVCTCGGSSKHAGIVSWVVECGSGFHPAVFTRTSCYVEWIKSGNEETNCGGNINNNTLSFESSNKTPSLVNNNFLSLGKLMALLFIMYRCVLFLFTDHP